MIGFALFHTWQTATHKGNGVVMFGGDSEASGTSSDEFFAIVPESEYKRHNFIDCLVFFVVGLGLLHHANQQQKGLEMKNLTPDQKTLYYKI